MARPFTKVTSEAVKGIQVNAGVILKKFDTTKAAAPEDEDIICATTGGITASCTPTVTDFGEDIDNCPKNVKEMMQIDGWDCTLSFTAVNITPELIRIALGAADIDATNTGKVTARSYYDTTNDFDDIWFVGDLNTGGYVAIKLYNAIGTGGLEIKTTDKGKGNISVTLTGCVSLDDPEVVPMEFYVSTTAVTA